MQSVCKIDDTMKYFYEFEVKYQDVDANRKLRLYVLENYLLEVAGKCADDLGFGIQYLHPQGLTWILTRLSLEVDYLPTYCTKLTIETWIESNAHMLSTRNYRFYMKEADGTQRLFGKAKSVWAVLDYQKREIANVFDQAAFEGIVDGEVLDITRSPRLGSLAETDGIVPHIVQFSDVDYNNHCNSCKYLERMIDAYRPDWYNKHLRLDIQYQHEQTLGGVLDTHYQIVEDGVQYRQKNADGTTCCAAKITIQDA